MQFSILILQLRRLAVWFHDSNSYNWKQIVKWLLKDILRL